MSLDLIKTLAQGCSPQLDQIPGANVVGGWGTLRHP